MTHAEMVEEVIKLHEWVKHWQQRAEAAENALVEAAEDTARLDWWQQYLQEKASEGLNVVITIVGPSNYFRGRIDEMRGAAIRAARGKQ